MSIGQENKFISACVLNHTAIKLKQQECHVARIVDFSVTTDSVVAKAVVVTDNDTHFIEVDWGDGETNNINVGKARYFKSAAYNGDNALQPGTYEFFHRYQVSYVAAGDSILPEPKGYTVILKTIDFNGDLDLRFQPIRIEPSYRINFYRLSVGLKNQCDNGSLNEFTIIRTLINEGSKREWSWRPSDNFFYPFPTYTIPESQIEQVFNVTENPNEEYSSIDLVSFTFIEHDKWYDERGTLYYDTILRNFLIGQQDSASGRFEGEIPLYDHSIFGSNCDLMYAVDWDLQLLVPLPPIQPVVFTKS